MAEAVKSLTDEEVDAEFAASVKRGIADIEAGRFVPYEKVRRWLLSWGADNVLPPPECP